jgi:hypothetical protein
MKRSLTYSSLQKRRLLPVVYFSEVQAGVVMLHYWHYLAMARYITFAPLIRYPHTLLQVVHWFHTERSLLEI